MQIIFTQTSKFKMKYYSEKSGFTLIELLTVIAIIGILAGIIIPTVSSVRTSANKSKTRVQFSQWASAMELFKQEYGYYPSIVTSNKVEPEKFAGALTGRNMAGTKYTTSTDANLAGNRKILSFYSIADSELNEAKTALVDAFGNTDIVCYVDSNSDGKVDSSDSPAFALTPVTPIDGGSLTPTASHFGVSVSEGVRGGVVFYSAGKGSAVTDIVLSWK
jgi:prepilin-type N-terminal cleavage/methylation domain-containing protein